MSRITWLNGNYVAHESAKIHVEDRGHLFSDGVYEVISVGKGKLVEGAAHYKRLQYSLSGLKMSCELSAEDLELIIQGLLERNNMCDGFAYLQVTRGVANRTHFFPVPSPKPNIFVMLSPSVFPTQEMYAKGITMITTPDLRWKRRDYKTISLLPNTLAKQEAVEAGADEAILVEEDGTITEGSSTNIFMVHADGTIQTPPANKRILAGITRAGVVKIARANEIEVIEEPFTPKDAYNASELFITSTTKQILPAVQLDNTQIGDGVPGEVTRRLRGLYQGYIEESFL